MGPAKLGQTLGALGIVALLALVTPALANHTQTDLGKSISFDHKTGNAYWVEVTIGGADAGRVTKVEAQVAPPSSHGWTVLPKQSWGAYGGSFPIGTDAYIRFRATFTDGVQAVSCWFAHPVGTETCSHAPPPGNWRSSLVGSAGPGFGGESVVVDVDFDGVGEVLVASEEAVYMFDHTATGWTRSTAFASGPDQDFRLIAVGTTDNDVVQEVYTVGRHYDGERSYDRLMWHHFTGERWSSEVVWDFRGVSDILIGNIDDAGASELLVVTNDGSNSIVYSIERTPGQFFFTEIARTPHELPLGRAAVGDADRDGDQELYVLHGRDSVFTTGVLRVDWTGTGYTQDFLFEGDYGTELNGFVAGDGDNDGLQELYLLDSAFFPDETSTLHRFSMHATGWTHTTIPLGKGLHYDLELGDGNGDGFSELYSGTLQGHLAQVMWSRTSSAWVVRAVYQLGSGEFLQDVSIGDTEGDGRQEVYGLSYDAIVDVCCPTTHLHRFAPLASTTTTSTSATTTTSGTTTSATTTGTGGFDATFEGVRGNAWWEQVTVTTTGGTLSKVDVRLNGGAWQPLQKQSWGGYAGSYHAVQGTIVQFRATSATGATDLSGCYRWISPSNTDAATTSCPGGGGTTTTSSTSASSTTSSGGFDATFSGVQGNEWWVQATVKANQAIAGVDARVNCGAWQVLAKQSWGGWAASFHVPDGSKVDFRARSTTGTQDVSGGYVWPSATPTSACP
ncbi:MAG TPA: hypothetical protein VM286_04590 [Candidatus Thermoplasmatota archaeon]|nr:hypothetical protein [Candidatus Thermoplasmatota archaeon]